jgi:hypothetical protein
MIGTSTVPTGHKTKITTTRRQEMAKLTVKSKWRRRSMYEASCRTQAIKEVRPEFSVCPSYRTSGKSMRKNENSGREHISILPFIRVTYNPGAYCADWNDPTVEVTRRCTG